MQDQVPPFTNPLHEALDALEAALTSALPEPVSEDALNHVSSRGDHLLGAEIAALRAALETATPCSRAPAAPQD